MTSPRIELRSVSLTTPSGRTLFRDLDLQLRDEHVGLVGHNGVGKSTLLGLLAGELTPTTGKTQLSGKRHYLPQIDEGEEPLSFGEKRRASLEAARASGADILLLDEPSVHLDDERVDWLRSWLRTFQGSLVVASHDRRILADFRHFFVVSEAGCHYFGGKIADLEQHLERAHQENEARYVQRLHRLANEEERLALDARRKARKKRRGRSAELDRATPRIRLNQKRSQAQVNHGRFAKLRQAKLAELRDWTHSARRALSVSLSLELPSLELPAATGESLLSLQGVAAIAKGRTLFEGVDLEVERERVAVVGPSGSGKTTLLEIMTGRRLPEAGRARADLAKIGYIEQGGRNFIRDASLRSTLLDLGRPTEEIASLLVTHRFPLGLADRALRTLSPGERARAALITIFARTPTLELLVLDEPTFGLDLVGQRALTSALTAWQGGLVVASHDRAFLEALRIDRTIRL